MKPIKNMVALALLCFSAMPFVSCIAKEEARSAVVEKIPVAVAKAQIKNVPLQTEATGVVEASSSVTITSRVSGQIKKLHFREGADVAKGDILVTIDSAPLQAKLSEAKAKLGEDRALLEFYRKDEERNRLLIDKGAISKSEYEKSHATVVTYEEKVKADMANIKTAELNLGYCNITAPIDGRTGAYLVSEGSIAQENVTKLVVINQISPVYAVFSVPEMYLPAIQKFSSENRLMATAEQPGYEGKRQIGELSFIDNTVNSKTGMITLKSIFANEEKRLWPGQFVNVTLTLTVQQDRVVVPSPAIALSQNGGYVYVIKPDMTVEYRPVKVDRKAGAETIIATGLESGETIVTDGQHKLKNGAAISIRPPVNTAEKESPKIESEIAQAEGAGK